MNDLAAKFANRQWWVWLLLAILFLIFLYLIRAILLPFVFGGMLAYFLDPAADKLEERNVPRYWAAALIITSFFLTAFLAIAWLVPVLYDQIGAFIAELPNYLDRLDRTFGQKFENVVEQVVNGNGKVQATGIIGTISTEVATFFSGFITGLLQSGAAFINLLSLILISPIVAFYLLRDWDHIVARIDSLTPLENQQTVREQAREIDRVLSGFLRGQIIVCGLLGTFYAVGLYIVDLKFSIVIGLATGVLAIIPYVGVLFGMVIGAGVALFQFGDYQHVALVLAVFGLGQFIEGNFVTPKLVGDRVGLHPAWVIFGMLAGGALFGFVGILLAVPVTAIIGVLVRFAIDRYLSSSLYKVDPSLTATHLDPPLSHS